MRIDIPKGSYVPVISHVPAPVNGGRCRIAVLPFLNLSNPGMADLIFAGAVTETLISALTLAGHFDVIGRTSVSIFTEFQRRPKTRQAIECRCNYWKEVFSAPRLSCV